MSVSFRDTMIGTVGIAEEDGFITGVFFENKTVPSTLLCEEPPLLQKAFSELFEYLDGKRHTFDLPLDAKGTEWQKKCWQMLLRIPYGETRSYGEIAALAGNPKASRAVGLANHRNPIPVFIPCHRVIGKDGSLTGFGGGIIIKEKLLALEKKNRI